MDQYGIVKSFEQQLKEEKEKLLFEVNEAVKRKMVMMMPTDNEFLK